MLSFYILVSHFVVNQFIWCLKFRREISWRDTVCTCTVIRWGIAANISEGVWWCHTTRYCLCCLVHSTLCHCYVGDKVKRNPGDRWMINGPTDYVPPIEVSILESRSLLKFIYLNCAHCSFRKAVSLNKNEGIYVRDIRSGQVKHHHIFICLYHVIPRWDQWWAQSCTCWKPTRSCTLKSWTHWWRKFWSKFIYVLLLGIEATTAAVNRAIQSCTPW